MVPVSMSDSAVWIGALPLAEEGFDPHASSMTGSISFLERRTRLAAILLVSLPVFIAMNLKPAHAGTTEDQPAPATHDGGVFGSTRIPISGIAAEGRWRPILSQMGTAQFSCTTTDDCTARGAELGRIAEGARALVFKDRLAAVNRAVNRAIKYVRDADLYGTLDYWAAPKETLALGRGDCEDIAILKMALLKEAGVPLSGMSLVVLRDTNRNIFHAVLSVSVGNRHFILDSLEDEVRLDTSFPGYQPLYSLGADRAWVHGYRVNGEATLSNTPLRAVTQQRASSM